MTDSRPEAALYLFPVTLGDGEPACVLPARNIELLKGIRHFVVENLRSARRFLRACSRDIIIDNLSFTELSEHTPASEVDAMLRPIIDDGLPIGVLSEAGCPAVADPGADIVAAAQRRGIHVIPLVGPSSILMSLMASGFNGQCFAFRGYLPIETKARTAAIHDMERNIRHRNQTQIFIETPYRNNRLIADLCRELPADMLLCVASDITGENESIITAPVSVWKSKQYNYSKIPTIFLLSH